MKGNTHGLPADGPDSVRHSLKDFAVVDDGLVVVETGFAVVGESWADSCDPLISTNVSPRVSVFSGSISSISSTRHLERLPRLQSPHLQRHPITWPYLIPC